MNEETGRFGLPYLIPGQAQKEFFHNEALVRIDAALHPAIEAAGAETPPPAPEEGQMWVLGTSPSGLWSGHSDSLALWCEGGWRFVRPQPGMLVWNKVQQLWIHWTGIAWSSGELPASAIRVNGAQIIGARQPEVPSPSGGTIIDEEARTTLSALIATLKSHGLIE